MEDNRSPNQPPEAVPLHILQLNCGNTNQSLYRGLLDSLPPRDYPIVALQEPYYNRHTSSTYHPKPYHLLYQPSVSTRVCFLVSKFLSLDSWTIQHLSPDIAQLSLHTDLGPIHITNVYNPTPQGPQLASPDLLTSALALPGSHILLGDFNLHHPKWGGVHVRAEQAAKDLLMLTNSAQLALATPPGAITWKRGPTRGTTIDLTFLSPALMGRLTQCEPSEEMALGKDHIPIRIHLDTAAPAQPATNRFQLRVLAKPGIQEILRQDFSARIPPYANCPLTASPDVINRHLYGIQEILTHLLETHIPKARGSQFARAEWTEECADLLQAHRRARREFASSQSPDAETQYKRLRNQFKSALRKSKRNTWRQFLEQFTADPRRGGLWKMARWARKSAGKPPEDPHMPPLRVSPGEQLKYLNEEKAQLLAAEFFPQPREVDLSDIPSPLPDFRRFPISPIISTELVTELLRNAAKRKSPGPDRIPNELLAILSQELAPVLAPIFTASCCQGYFPTLGKKSTTVVLRKEGRGDYSIPTSFRPIALENTLSKILESALTEKISQAAEQHNLLPPSQMGARRNRSTLTAIELLDETIRTAWKYRASRSNIVSMLSLDISGAFPNTSHPRLLYILRQKGYPEWTIQILEGFLSDRTTTLIFGGYESKEFPILTGMPQGSPLSPILFLLFSGELLSQFESGETRGVGLIDDTNLLTISPSAERNCRALERAHEKCLKWALRHGVRFAPNKYKLIHFTRRRDPAAVRAQMRIQGFDGKPCEELRVLGVWLDRKLTYQPHIQKAAEKGASQLQKALHITQSTWGLSFQNSRLLYTAVVRPTLTYGAPIWSLPEPGDPLPASTLYPLRKTQNSSLRRVTGAYRAASIPSLEREAHIPPLDLHLRTLRLGYTAQTAPATKQYLEQRRQDTWQRCIQLSGYNRPIPRGRREADQERIQHAINITKIKKRVQGASRAARETRMRTWGEDPLLEDDYDPVFEAHNAENIARNLSPEPDPQQWDPRQERDRLNPFTRRRPRRKPARGQDQQAHAQGHARTDCTRPAQTRNRNRHPNPTKKPATIRAIRELEFMDWAERWENYRKEPGRTAPTYHHPLSQKLRIPTLHQGFPRAQSSLLTLLRTEKIGFNDFLARQNVPDVQPACECGWARQTPKHVVVHCPLLGPRTGLWEAAGTRDYNTALSTPCGAAAITGWLLRQCGPHRLAQFQVARELSQTRAPLASPLEVWW